MELVLSLLVLLMFALLAGALWLWRRGGARKQVLLMLLLAAIVAGNVAVWTIPVGDGTAPISAAPSR